MRAPVSVVIPTLNSQHVLPGCLASVFEGVQAGLIRELIVVDGGSTDETTRIAQEVGALVLTEPASRGGQLRRGCAEAAGDWLLVLHADSHLQEGWSDVVADHLGHAEMAAYFKLRFDAGGRAGQFVAGWANVRSRLFGLPYGDQGLLISRPLYRDCKGYADIPLMEDVAIARALRGRLRPLPVRLTTSADRYQQQGWVRRGTRNLLTLTRYLLGARPEVLAESYRRS